MKSSFLHVFGLGSGVQVCLCVSMSDFKTGYYFACVCASYFFFFPFLLFFALMYEPLKPEELEEKFLCWI